MTLPSRLDTAAGRAKLPKRREPYWMPLAGADGFLGFRRGPDTWVARLREDGRQIYHALGRYADHRAAARAALAWVDSRRQGVTTHNATVRDACEASLANLEREKGVQPAREIRSRLQRRILGRTFRSRAIAPHALARKPLAKLTPVDFERWRDGLIPNGVADSETLRQKRASTKPGLLCPACRPQLCPSAPHGGERFRMGGREQVSGHPGHRVWHLPRLEAAPRASCGRGRGGARSDRGVPADRCAAGRARAPDGGQLDPASGTVTLTSYKGRSPEARRRVLPLRALRAEALFKRLAQDKLPKAPLFTREDGKAPGSQRLGRARARCARRGPAAWGDLRLPAQLDRRAPQRRHGCHDSGKAGWDLDFADREDLRQVDRRAGGGARCRDGMNAPNCQTEMAAALENLDVIEAKAARWVEHLEWLSAETGFDLTLRVKSVLEALERARRRAEEREPGCCGLLRAPGGEPGCSWRKCPPTRFRSGHSCDRPRGLPRRRKTAPLAPTLRRRAA